MLEVRALSKSYGPSVVLSNFSETFEAGRVHGLIGANGAGKSTFIKLISGVHAATSGSIHFEGRQLSFSSPRDAYDAGIRTLQQETDSNLYTSLSVIENIVLRTKSRSGLRRLVRRSDRTDARRRLGLIGAEGMPLDKRVGDFPLAQRQEIALACALDPAAKLLILDEPTASIDRADVERLMATIRTIRDHGASVIYVSHHLDEVISLVDRVTILRGGAAVDRFDIGDQLHAGAAAKDRIISGMLGRTVAESLKRLDDGGGKVQAPPVQSGKAALRLDDIVTPVVRNVSLAVQPGEIVVLAGLVGSGGDDLLRVAYGLERPTAGSVEIAGKVFHRLSPGRAIDVGVGFVPGDRARLGLHLDESVAWNTVLPVLRAVSGLGGILNKAKIAAFARRSRDDLQIVARDLDAPARSLSGGNQQKIVFGKCMARRPALILLDEPTRGVDVGTRVQIYKRLRDLAASGVAVLCTTYDFAEAAAIADRVLVMRRGAVTEQLTGGDITESTITKAAMGGSNGQHRG